MQLCKHETGFGHQQCCSLPQKDFLPALIWRRSAPTSARMECLVIRHDKEMRWAPTTTSLGRHAENSECPELQGVTVDKGAYTRPQERQCIVTLKNKKCYTCRLQAGVFGIAYQLHPNNALVAVQPWTVWMCFR